MKTKLMVLGLLLSACGTRVETSLLVTVNWSDAPDLVVLEFIGPSAGQSIRLPSALPTDALTSGQTARILVSDAQVGQMLTLTVNGLNRDFAVVSTGTAQSPTVAQNKELAMAVTLEKAAPPDAGVCLGPIEVRPATGVFVVGCSSGASCLACNATADRCVNGACSCGDSGAPCGPGLLCVRNATGASCVCSLLSGCQGCCSATGACLPYATSQTKTACGAAGNTCVDCPGPANQCAQGVCTARVSCTSGAACASANECGLTSFPSCREPIGRCVACDVFRSNKCAATGCACGNSEACSGAQRCLQNASKTDFECRALN